jgi:AmmeMemoRadiSam system protein A
LNGFLGVAQRKGLKIRLLGACNSGDTAGGQGRVVGYSSFALYGEEAVSPDEAGRTLVSLAREVIDNALHGRQQAPQGGAAWLKLRGASFVTLTKAGRLRGCIGSLEIGRPLGEDVAHNAFAAAFKDPRFAKLALEEWPECRLEVSVLSAPKPLRFADEADLLAQLKPGEDGVILECEGKRATYLPQVWEALPDKRLFLAELLKKAGLPADTRLGRCRVQRYRVRKFI